MDREEKLDQINDLIAYINNENEEFDFGEGSMKMDSSESTHYEIELALLKYRWECDSIDCICVIFNDISDTSDEVLTKGNKYYINHVYQKEKNRKIMMSKSHGYCNPYYEFTDENGKNYLKRYYRAKRSKHLKRQSNRVIRRNKEYFPKGNKVKRQFDYWWILY